MEQIPSSWWLEHESCKYMLAILVHKNNKDISSNPITLPAGATQNVIRKNRTEATEVLRDTAKSARSIGSKLDVQIKKMRVDGMRSQVEKNNVDSIIAQINVMRDNEQVYKAVHGELKYQENIVKLMDKLPGMGGNAEVEIVNVSSMANDDYVNGNDSE